MDDIKILLVDDEEDILDFLSYNLKAAGFDVYTAGNGRAALTLADQIQPQLILLDVMMPQMDGIETCEELRRNKRLQNTVIAFLTARSEDYSQIAGFEAGADDYISKPVKPKVLVSRIKALLKRIEPKNIEPIIETTTSTIDRLIIDRERYVVYVDGKEIILPRKEFELLELLASKPDRLFTREEIFNRVWGKDNAANDRTIDVHIRKIREKIGDDFITTVKGVGYKFLN